jgi:hypothetical protein
MSARGRPWTTQELQQLRDHAHLGAEAVAELLDRTVRSVQVRAARDRISLRRPGEARGALLGQPRGVQLSSEPHLAALRVSVLASGGDLGQLPQLRRDARLCPSCGAHYATTSSGFCQPCYMGRLAAAYSEQQATRTMERKLWQLRQDASRARRKAREL